LLLASSSKLQVDLVDFELSAEWDIRPANGQLPTANCQAAPGPAAKRTEAHGALIRLHSIPPAGAAQAVPWRLLTPFVQPHGMESGGTPIGPPKGSLLARTGGRVPCRTPRITNAALFHLPRSPG
jgi:hypothetical protein